MPVDKLKRRELISLLDGTRQRGHSPRVRGIRKVLVVNTADEGGGTERFAWLLFKGLEQRQIEAWMVVGQKNSNDPHVITIHSSPLLHYGPYQNFWHRQVVPALRAIEGRIGTRIVSLSVQWTSSRYYRISPRHRVGQQSSRRILRSESPCRVKSQSSRCDQTGRRLARHRTLCRARSMRALAFRLRPLPRPPAASFCPT